MSKFFVGQRVRIKVSPEFPHLVGAEAKIIGDGFYADEPIWDIRAAGEDDWYVEKDDAEEVLEPILPEGSAPSEYTFQQLMDNLQEVMA
ncbi:hypothetical protein [Stenotrophomonas maltophilia]|uniref:hypothetical protein n=1 Tax=Stenotrophomonas maltophilia TaxID=40324 RepID=UPI0007F886F7|nr:hypothetical protein [Stenotrophomonas maltophilia]OBU59202.1 hypothetical protein A9K70_01380 [Stenotrophomonas maltophilia]